MQWCDMSRDISRDISHAPYIISPEWLATKLDTQPGQYLLIDMSKPGIYAQAHLPNAINLDYNRLQLGGSAAGLAPKTEDIEKLLSEIGLTENTHVIAYDEEGGTRAARFLWILALAGHKHFSYLDGGIHAWLAQELPYSSEPTAQPASTDYRISALQPQHLATIDDVIERHQNADTIIWDARSPEEYLGIRVNSKRGGHIPGAVNYNWENAIDRDNHNLLRPLAEIRKELSALGISADKEVITHCQTHHRSSFTWLLAKHLGFENVRGYAGSWSEWGNREDTPIALPSQSEIDTHNENMEEFDLELELAF